MFKKLAAMPRKDLALSLGLGMAQGLIFWLFAIEIKTTAENQWWKIPALIVAIFIPVSYFSLRPLLPSGLLARFLPLQAALLAAMAVYGVYLYPTGESNLAGGGPLFSIFIAWALTLLLLAAKMRQRLEGGSFYAGICSAKLGLVFAYALSGALLGAFWLLLLLWGMLFKVVKISFFADLFSEEIFVCTVTGAVLALTLTLAQDRLREKSAMPKWMTSPCIWLLPLACFITLLFLFTLPFTGLEPLWDTGHATVLMLVLQLVVIALLAAAYQDGSTQLALPGWLRRFITAALAALPVYALLCVYALYLRVDQHGWSADRVWAAFVIAAIGFAAFGSAYAALKPGEWLQKLGRVNTGFIFVVLTLAVGAGTPLLSPERIAAASLVNRLMQGAVKAEKFDYAYLHFNLGVYGKQTLKDLSLLTSHAEAETIRRFASAELERQYRYQERAVVTTAEDLAERLDVFPEGEKADPDFIAFLLEQLKAQVGNINVCMKSAGARCTVLKADLNGDGEVEYVVLNQGGALYARRDGKWEYAGNLQNVYRSSEDWLKDLKASGYRVEKPQWGQLIIGKHRLNVWEQPKENRHGHD
jgi:hypothetical protein